MRMRKHFATGAALTAAAAMILTACGGGSSTSTTSTDGGSKASEGPKGMITAGVAYETTDYGPITHLGSRHGCELAGPRGPVPVQYGRLLRQPRAGRR